jgi:hypothetical protein
VVAGALDLPLRRRRICLVFAFLLFLLVLLVVVV